MINLLLALVLVLHCCVVTLCSVECDYRRFANGCDDRYNQECNVTRNECQCKTEFSIKIDDDYCLPARQISESCYTTEQCRLNASLHTIGCFLEDRELDTSVLKSWIESDTAVAITGVCACQPGYYYSLTNSACVVRKLYNENCTTSEECTVANAYCDQYRRQCRCKPSYRYSAKRDRCVPQVIGQSCYDSEICLAHDRNAECRIGSCQCKSGYTISRSDRCTSISRNRNTTHHVLMMLVVVGTAVVFAMLSTVHKKWSTSRTSCQSLNTDIGNNSALDSNDIATVGSNSRMTQTQSIPPMLPSLAVIWPLGGHQNDMNQLPREEAPPSYAEAIRQNGVTNCDTNAASNNNTIIDVNINRN